MNSQQPVFRSIAAGQSETVKSDTASRDKAGLNTASLDTANLGAANPGVASPIGASEEAVTLDLTMARENFGSDEALLCEIAIVFIEDVPQLIAELEQACRNSDSGTVCRMAHSLKGLCATFGAEPARTYAQGIEHDCCEGRVVPGQRIDLLVQSLRRTMATLRSELRLSA